MKNVQAILLEHFGDWITPDGIKQAANVGRRSESFERVYGIQKLRELIYELAANGRIIDFEEGTEERLLGEVSEFIMGQAPPGSECNKKGDGVVFVKTGEFGALYPRVEEWTTKPLKYAKKGDILICVVGATIGKLNLAIDCAIGRSVAAIRPINCLDSKYLYSALIPFTLKLRKKSRGSAQGVIGKSELSQIKIRVPSLSTQKKLVAKIEELMSLCDLLEKKSLESVETHLDLINRFIQLLMESTTNEEFSGHFDRIFQLFNKLFVSNSSLDSLKACIYQIAIMGKLTNIENHAERSKSINKMVAKSTPFSIPDDWSWKALSELGVTVTGKTPPTSNVDFYEGGTPFIGPGQLTNDYKILDAEKFISKGAENFAGIANPGDILMVCIGGSIGKSAISKSRIAFNQQINSISLKECSSEYVHICMKSDYFQNEIKKLSSGSATPIINKSKWGNLLIPVPPLEEQVKIENKVDMLINLCNQLQNRLIRAETLKINIVDVLVEREII